MDYSNQDCPERFSLQQVNLMMFIFNEYLPGISIPVDRDKNSKIIIVTRDPRDIFSSMKTRQSKGSPSYDVNLFCEWFLSCFNRLNFKKTIH